MVKREEVVDGVIEVVVVVVEAVEEGERGDGESGPAVAADAAAAAADDVGWKNPADSHHAYHSASIDAGSYLSLSLKG